MNAFDDGVLRLRHLLVEDLPPLLNWVRSESAIARALRLAWIMASPHREAWLQHLSYRASSRVLAAESRDARDPLGLVTVGRAKERSSLVELGFLYDEEASAAEGAWRARRLVESGLALVFSHTSAPRVLTQVAEQDTARLLMLDRRGFVHEGYNSGLGCFELSIDRRAWARGVSDARELSAA